jgi:hypothetical protein
MQLLQDEGDMYLQTLMWSDKIAKPIKARDAICTT